MPSNSDRATTYRDLQDLIRELYFQPPTDDITDSEILDEIRAVRRKNRQA